VFFCRWGEFSQEQGTKRKKKEREGREKKGNLRRSYLDAATLFSHFSLNTGSAHCGVTKRYHHLSQHAVELVCGFFLS
jgi:hypothetical protein